MTRGINKVEDVGLAIGRGVFHAGGLELDGDAAFALQLHVVEKLRLHVASRNSAGVLQEPIGQGGFPVVDVGDDAEIADPLYGNVCHRAGGGYMGAKSSLGDGALQAAQPGQARSRASERAQKIQIAPDAKALSDRFDLRHLEWCQHAYQPMSTEAVTQDPHALTLENVERTLDELRPYLMADGGNVEVVEIDGPIVKVRLQGACGSCPSSTMTLKMGIERKLREAIPEVSEVVQVL